MSGDRDGSRKPTVLAVDDDPTLLRVLALQLELDGYDVTTADSGEAALEVFSRGRPDAIIVDAMMPGIDGLEVCRRLRDDVAGRETPVIVLTAYPGLESEAMASGADRFVTKPYDVSRLSDVVREVLDLPHQRP